MKQIAHWCVLVFCVAAICSSLLSFSQQESKPLQNPATQSADSNGGAVVAAVVREGTPVKLKLRHSLNSKTVVVGDPLNFVVAEDVVVNGRTLIKAGAVAIGRVQQAKAARTLGRGAQLTMEMQYVKVGRVRVPLRGTQANSGANKTDETVALVALFGLSGLVKHGSEIEVKEASIFTAYVDHDTELQLTATPTY